MLFQCSVLFSNACCVLWFLRNSARYFQDLPLINVLIREKIIIKFVIHVILFTNWWNVSFFENIRKFAHLYRFIKNICQIFGVDLSILLRNFVGIWPAIVDLVIGKILIAFLIPLYQLPWTKIRNFKLRVWNSLIFFILSNFLKFFTTFERVLSSPMFFFFKPREWVASSGP